MNLGVCWQDNVWQDGSWVDDAWCPEIIPPCTSDIIGNVWVQSSWEETAWCQGTWANRFVPPTPTIVAVEQRRWPGPPIIIYDEAGQIRRIKRRMKDNEEIIIL